MLSLFPIHEASEARDEINFSSHQFMTLQRTTGSAADAAAPPTKQLLRDEYKRNTISLSRAWSLLLSC